MRNKILLSCAAGIILMAAMIAAGCAKSETAAGPQEAQPTATFTNTVADTSTPTITLTPVPTVTAPGANEPGNDVYTGAVPAGQLTPVAGNHYHACDVDWFVVYVPYTSYWYFDTQNLGGNSDTVVYLYSAGDLTTPIASNDNMFGLAGAVRGTYSAGTYYIKVIHKVCEGGIPSGSLPGPNTGYEFLFQET